MVRCSDCSCSLPASGPLLEGCLGFSPPLQQGADLNCISTHPNASSAGSLSPESFSMIFSFRAKSELFCLPLSPKAALDYLGRQAGSCSPPQTRAQCLPHHQHPLGLADPQRTGSAEPDAMHCSYLAGADLH